MIISEQYKNYQSTVDSFIWDCPKWDFIYNFPLNEIKTQGGDLTREEWIKWIKEECPIHRFGGDVGLDYYEKMELWWLDQLKNPEKCIKPIVGIFSIDTFVIIDGHHRVALSHKNDLEAVPVIACYV